MPELSLVHRVRPASAGPPPHPAIILLHGLGADELDLHFLAQGVRPELHVISVRAPLAHTWGGYMWYDLDEGPGLGGVTIEESLRLLSSFLTEILEPYAIDPTRLYVGGFSQGAAMSGAIALLAPECVAAAVMISGYLPPPTAIRGYEQGSGRGRPFFQAHGTADTVVPILYARQTRDFLRDAGVDLQYREYPVGHEVGLSELQDLDAWMGGVLTSRSSRL